MGITCTSWFIEKFMINQIKLYGYSNDVINMYFNVDGIPVFKSRATELYPFLGRFDRRTPSLVTLYCGTHLNKRLKTILP